MNRSRFAFASLALATMVAAGCHSAHVEVTVENRTGAEVRLLEVDYPSASFGKDSLGAGATFHYRVQLQNSGPVKVQYTAPDNSQPQITGPSMSQGEQGALRIVLLPGGKAEFHPQINPAR